MNHRQAVSTGHLGEWITSRIFDIQLEAYPSAKGIDARFRSGPLRESTVNVKWNVKHQAGSTRPTKTRSKTTSSSKTPRFRPDPHVAPPRRGCIVPVYVFDALRLKTEQLAGVKLGIESSVT